jgi:hypothetical protein
MVSWQFFNEIDNSYVPRSALVHEDVVAWHRAMGQWLRANDPYHHLISTSLTGASDRVYHSYGEADPARYVAKLSADMAARYRKPVMIGEIGTNHLGWQIHNDPYLRGFRQGLWGGTLGGSLGTSMAWWWEDIHADNVYPLYTVVRDVMARAGWHDGRWEPATFVEPAPAPGLLGDARPDGEPFTAIIALNQLRLNPVSGSAAIADPLAAARAAERISSFLHGPRNPHLQQHARLTAHFASGARLVFRVNSVAADADLLVRIDGGEKLRTPLVNSDGLASALADEINQEFTVDVPAGRHVVEIAHTGPDWITLKSLRLERVRPAPFAEGWEFTADAIGLRRTGGGPATAVVYVRSPHVAWPAGALRFNPPVVRAAVVTLTGWPAGNYEVLWIDPASGREITLVGATASDNRLPLAAPDFSDDIVALVLPAGPR